ncbi:hypothetical protein ACH5RR_024016 [Cinchona calisaya]|uniref:RING-type E3 ubiquitin transferase n=1 Tax=Cinchona calisaya TaxID=153742 RepID=A0ABD2ZDE6_9GENT
MSTARAADESNNSNNRVDTTQFLGDQIFRDRLYLRRPPSLLGAARLLRRPSGRRMMRETSMRVREAAAEQIEERRSDWAYSKPIVFLDLLWNFALVVVSISVLIISRNESPSTPLRLWVVGYALQCLLHMVCVCLEYKKRRQQRYLMGDSSWRSGGSRNHGGRWNSSHSSSGSDQGEFVDYGSDGRQNDEETRSYFVLGAKDFSRGFQLGVYVFVEGYAGMMSVA